MIGCLFAPFAEENKDANSTSQHATVEYHLEEAL